MKLPRRAALLALLALITASPANAINFGQPDSDNDYPWVGLMLGLDAEGFFVCSGSLIAPTVFLTASHCLDAPAVYFVTMRKQSPYSLSRDFVVGTPYTHPGWNGAFTIPNTSDVGVIVLDESLPGPYGMLAPQDFVDTLLLRRGTQDLRFMAAGYGLQNSQPVQSRKPSDGWDLSRYIGEQRLMQTDSIWTDGYNIQLTNNPGLGNGVGGTCSGDSGGPIFHKATGYIVAVNSFGVAPYCKGNDYAYRTDTQYSLEFIQMFLR